MASLEMFREMTEDYSGLADFVLVYIAEAHPTDGWAVRGNVFQVANHRSMEERVTAAKKMLAMEPQDCPVLLDRFDDAANKAYSALPERLYIVKDGTIVYKGGPGPFRYNLKAVEDWLKQYKAKKA